eukprot:4818138-Lingulodinium_polyedra.AAC.1
MAMALLCAPASGHRLRPRGVCDDPAFAKPGAAPAGNELSRAFVPGLLAAANWPLPLLLTGA